MDSEEQKGNTPGLPSDKLKKFSITFNMKFLNTYAFHIPPIIPRLLINYFQIYKRKYLYSRAHIFLLLISLYKHSSTQVEVGSKRNSQSSKLRYLL